MCNLHEIVVRTNVNKGETLNSPSQVLKVEVSFCHLEGTLIPFGNVGQHCDGKLIGTVPLPSEMAHKFQPINHDRHLQGYCCYLTNYNVRYFVKEKQKYYRIGDLLSIRTIVDVMHCSAETCNYVFFWAILCTHASAQARSRKTKRTIIERSKTIKSMRTEKTDEMKNGPRP